MGVGRPAGHGRAAGLDAVRLAAAAAVFVHHACSLLGHDDWTVIVDARVGRCGTAVFFALSGYLAGTTTRPPGPWLWARACRLGPAYWAVVLVGFAAAAATGHKRFDAAQVVCQLLGIGLFTHPGSLVGVTTWFVSLLAPLYLTAYLARRTGGAAAVVALIGAAGAGLGGSVDPVLASHAASFLAAFLAAGVARFRAGPLAAWAVTLGVLSAAEPAFRYSFVALAALAVGVASPWGTRAGRAFAAVGYEWFLVHGLALHAVIRLGADSLATLLPAAAVLSVGAAVGLRSAVASVGVWLGARPAPTPVGAAPDRVLSSAGDVASPASA